MAADQDRADRIRALKKDHPEYTWQAIADQVGVSLRAAQSWQEKGGIEYENAKKLAALWDEDLDYIMRGRRGETPDLSLANPDDDRLARIETKLEDASKERVDLVATLDQRIEELDQRIADQNANLARQSEILERLQQLVSVLTGQDEDAGHPLRTVAQAARILEAARHPDQTDQPAARKRERGGQASSRAS